MLHIILLFQLYFPVELSNCSSIHVKGYFQSCERIGCGYVCSLFHCDTHESSFLCYRCHLAQAISVQTSDVPGTCLVLLSSVNLFWFVNFQCHAVDGNTWRCPPAGSRFLVGHVQISCNCSAKERTSSDVPQPRGRWRQPQHNGSSQGRVTVEARACKSALKSAQRALEDSSSVGVRSFHGQVPESVGQPRGRARQKQDVWTLLQHDHRDFENWRLQRRLFLRQIWTENNVCAGGRDHHDRSVLACRGIFRRR